MTIVGILLFIAVISGGSVYNHVRRTRADHMLQKTRKETQQAIKEMHEVINA